MTRGVSRTSREALILNEEQPSKILVENIHFEHVCHACGAVALT